MSLARHGEIQPKTHSVDVGWRNDDYACFLADVLDEASRPVFRLSHGDAELNLG